MTISSLNSKSSSNTNSYTLKRKLDQNNTNSPSSVTNDNNDSDDNNNNNNTLILRKKICLKKLNSLIAIKNNFIESITEHYFIKLNKNYLDYHDWKLAANKEYTDYLNDQLSAKNDIAILEVRKKILTQCFKKLLFFLI